MTEVISITDFEFSPLFSRAIESKVEAEQKALQAENDLRRIEVEARQREANASRSWQMQTLQKPKVKQRQ